VNFSGSLEEIQITQKVDAGDIDKSCFFISKITKAGFLSHGFKKAALVSSKWSEKSEA